MHHGLGIMMVTCRRVSSVSGRRVVRRQPWSWTPPCAQSDGGVSTYTSGASASHDSSLSRGHAWDLTTASHVE